jgi:hypothetical protein
MARRDAKKAPKRGSAAATRTPERDPKKGSRIGNRASERGPARPPKKALGGRKGADVLDDDPFEVEELDLLGGDEKPATKGPAKKEIDMDLNLDIDLGPPTAKKAGKPVMGGKGAPPKKAAKPAAQDIDASDLIEAPDPLPAKTDKIEQMKRARAEASRPTARMVPAAGKPVPGKPAVAPTAAAKPPAKSTAKPEAPKDTARIAAKTDAVKRPGAVTMMVRKMRNVSEEDRQLARYLVKAKKCSADDVKGFLRNVEIALTPITLGDIVVKKELISFNELKDVKKALERGEDPGTTGVLGGADTTEIEAVASDDGERFGERALKKKFLNKRQLWDALKLQAKRADDGDAALLGEILIEKGFINLQQGNRLLQNQNVELVACDKCGKQFNVANFTDELQLPCLACSGTLDYIETLESLSGVAYPDDKLDAAKKKKASAAAAASTVTKAPAPAAVIVDDDEEVDDLDAFDDLELGDDDDDAVADDRALLGAETTKVSPADRDAATKAAAARVAEPEVEPLMDVGWHVAVGEEAKGPYTAEELLDMAANGKITQNDFIWTELFGEEWKQARDIPALKVAFARAGLLSQLRGDPVEKLKQLNELRKDGVLTDAEFADFKARILAQ